MLVLPDAAPGVRGLTRPQALSRLEVVTAARAAAAAKAQDLETGLAEARDDVGVLEGRARPAVAATPAATSLLLRRARSDVGAGPPGTGGRARRAEEGLRHGDGQLAGPGRPAERHGPPTPDDAEHTGGCARRGLCRRRQVVGTRTRGRGAAGRGRRPGLDPASPTSSTSRRRSTSADLEIEALRGRIGGRTATWLPLLAVDARGLTVNGDRCPFFPTDSRPFLVESALGRVGLYGRGPSGEVAYAQFETVTSRPTATLPGAGGGLGLVLRSPRLLARAGSFVHVDIAGAGAKTCDVSISLRAQGRSWTRRGPGSRVMQGRSPRRSTVRTSPEGGGSRLVVAVARSGRLGRRTRRSPCRSCRAPWECRALRSRRTSLSHWESSGPERPSTSPPVGRPGWCPAATRRGSGAPRTSPSEAWVDATASTTPRVGRRPGE